MRLFFALCAWLFMLVPAHAAEPPYEVKVNSATSESKKILEEHLDLITQRNLDDLDQDQIEIMLEDAPDQAQKFLQTLGYFNAKVTIEPDGKNYILNVDLGTPVKINDVAVLIDGDILQDEELAERYVKAMDGWTLPVGSTFNQDDWSGSKERALRSITIKHYPLAKIINSKAEIDLEEKTAALLVEIDSKSFIRFGDITVTGAKRYPESVAENLADFKRGTPYSLTKLLEYQTALEQDGHYSNASVGPRFDQRTDEFLPLTVSVQEVPRQKLDAAVRYDSEEGVSLNGGYTFYNVFNRGYVGSTAGKFGNYEQSASVGLASPRNSNGYIYSGNFGFENTEWQKLRTKATNAGLWQIRQRGDIEAKIGIDYIKERSRITKGGEDFGQTEAFLVRFGWLQRKVDDIMHPRNGYLVNLNLDTTLDNFASSTQFARTQTRAVYYYTPKESKVGTFLVHGELGHIFAKNKNRMPKTMLFRTGGATTVRGYEYQGIGVDLPNNAVIGGTSMAMFSLEYQHPVSPTISLAAFHDEGAIDNKMSKLKFHSSNGVGVRWFSPVAPLALDIAHAERDNKWRWHLSLGLTF